MANGEWRNLCNNAITVCFPPFMVRRIDRNMALELNNTELSFDNAVTSLIRGFGGSKELASIVSDEENNRVLQLLPQSSETTFWIGGWFDGAVCVTLFVIDVPHLKRS